MVAMHPFRSEKCFFVWNGFFGQVEFGLDGVPCLSHGIIYPFVANARSLQEMLHNARKVAEQKFKFLLCWMRDTKVRIGCSGGEGGIRTHGAPLRHSVDFESTALSRSATSPN